MLFELGWHGGQSHGRQRATLGREPREGLKPSAREACLEEPSRRKVKGWLFGVIQRSRPTCQALCLWGSKHPGSAGVLGVLGRKSIPSW